MKISVSGGMIVFTLMALVLAFDTSNGLYGQKTDSAPPAEQEQDPEEKSSESTESKEQDSTTDSSQKTETKSEEKKPKPFQFSVAEDSINFMAPGTWKKATPKSSMIEAEIKIVKQDDDKEDGRLTVMGAGGTIEANITRWQGQFVEEDGAPVEVKKEEKTISDCKVTIVDLEGTYIDTPGGPFAGGAKVERPDYRMLSAIIQTKTRGNYFVKFYGPKNTVEKNAEAFKEMIDSLKVTEKETK